MLDKNCLKCGIGIKVFPHNYKRGKGRFCSLSCAASRSSKNRDQCGDKNPNWRGGASINNRRSRYYAKYPEKYVAHKELTAAIRSGLIKRLPCKICGNEKVEGHHENYSDTLVVIWLCKKHHLEAHGGRLDNHL